jgi:prephenate dehydrogenase
MKDVVALVAPHLTQTTILADICSVKVQPLHDMLAQTTTPVVGTHPLFGPQTLDAELRIAVTPGRDQAASDNLSDCFRTWGFPRSPQRPMSMTVPWPTSKDSTS